MFPGYSIYTSLCVPVFYPQKNCLDIHNIQFLESSLLCVQIVLCRAISKARENVISDAIHDSMTITTHTYTEPANTTTSTHSMSPFKRPTVRKVPSPPFEQPQRQVTVMLQDQKVLLLLLQVPPDLIEFVNSYHPQPKLEDPDVDDPDIFSLEGFNEDEPLDDPDGVRSAEGDMAFPQSDDEDISTDGVCALLWCLNPGSQYT